MQRLEDIHKELLRQMRPLKRQANAAARYDDVRTTARGLRLYLGGRELAEIEDRLTEARAQEGTAAIREERDTVALQDLSLIHISEPTRRATISRMPSSA